MPINKAMIEGLCRLKIAAENKIEKLKTEEGNSRPADESDILDTVYKSKKAHLRGSLADIDELIDLYIKTHGY